MPLTHRCPARGCQTLVEHRKLACARHWSMVSRPTQTLIYRAWLRRRTERTQEAIEAHLAACKAAIGEINAQLPGN
jgi:hypothetical protein